jgi:hypothetical protein
MPYGNINVDTVTTSTTGGVLGAGNASAMKNRIINGGMVIDQRNAGAASTSPAAGSGYLVDRWYYAASQASKFTAQQNQGSVTPPVGFSYYQGLTSSSAYSVLAADYFIIAQYIEGFNTADLAWGTANAASVTLSFKVYSSLTGTFGGVFSNSANTRSYPFTYTISSANTWTTVSITISGDTSGTWIGATNGIGLKIIFGLGVGSTYSGTAGAWAGSTYLSATGATSVVGTSGATFYITGVQLEVGSSATGFEYRQYGTELVLCQRYYEVISTNNGQYAFISYNFQGTTDNRSSFGFQVIKRAIPTFTLFSGASWANSTPILYPSVDAVGAYSPSIFYLLTSSIYQPALGISAEL